MKNIDGHKFFFLFMCFFIASCQNNNSNSNRSTFEIKGNIIENQGFEKVYLSCVVENNIILIDSSEIKDNTFYFKGKATYPKKSQIQFYQFGNYFPFILSGEKIEITLNASNLSESKITGSTINKEWDQLKLKSFEIFGDIDYLFPLLQKARMQNDFETLTTINKKIDSIEILNRNYLIDYVNKNPESQLSALILNDLFHSSKTDSLIILQTAKKIPPDFLKALEFELNP